MSDSIKVMCAELDGMATRLMLRFGRFSSESLEAERIEKIAKRLRSLGESLRQVPDGLLDRVKAAEERINADQCIRRIPADPTDPDLVMCEVRMWLEGRGSPLWIKGNERKFSGVGELERSGYIPEGSADERDATPAQAGAVCTCPSGDGSLRWPCPKHPPKEEWRPTPCPTCGGFCGDQGPTCAEAAAAEAQAGAELPEPATHHSGKLPCCCSARGDHPEGATPIDDHPQMRLDDYTKEEFRAVAMAICPHWGDEEFEQKWAEFIVIKSARADCDGEA